VHGREKLVSVWFVQHDASQIGDRIIEFFGGFVNALDEPGGRARNLLQIKTGSAQTTSAPFLQHWRRIRCGDDGDVLVAEKADISMTKRASW